MATIKQTKGDVVGGDQMQARKGPRRTLPVERLVSRMSHGQAVLMTYKSVEDGIPATALRGIEDQGLTRDDIRMIIPDRTLDRRIAEGAALKLEEADGIARLLRVVGMARRVFGDDALADEWVRAPNPALDDHIPIRMARTDLGGREVEAVLGRIEHGVFGQVRVWRLTKAEHAPGLDGEGARLWGGRWNSPGVPMVYAASSLALAALEVLVHLPPRMRRAGGFPPFVAVGLDLPDDPVPRVPQDGPREEARRIGDDWVRDHASLALWVPSAVIPQDWNLLINPTHPDIAQVRVALTEPFRFDERLGI